MGLSAKGSVALERAKLGGRVPAATGKMAALTSLTQVKIQRFTTAYLISRLSSCNSTTRRILQVTLYFKLKTRALKCS